MKNSILRRCSLLALLVAGAGSAQAAMDTSRPDQFEAGWIDFAMYVPNRLLDLADIVTIEGSAGSSAACEVNVTRFFQLGGAYGETYRAGWGYARQYGSGFLSASEVGVACWNYNTSYFDWISGTMRNYIFHENEFNLVNPASHAYRENTVDLWSVGADVALIAGVDIQFHPVAVADFVTGLVGVDLEGDDL